MDEEIYVPVNDDRYRHLYEVSNHGNVRSIRRNIILTPCLRNGYLSVGLSNRGSKNHMIHRLVAEAFLENPDDLPIVNHIGADGNKLNNHVSNLEYTSYKSNAQHSVNVLKKKRSTIGVIQMTSEGEEIARFPSMIDAERATGVPNAQISLVCKSSTIKTARGYRWAYINPQATDPRPEGRSLPEFPNYIITDQGRVYSLFSNKYLALKTQEAGYLTIKLCNDVNKKDFYVHDLVAQLYLEYDPERKYTNHIDRDKSNCSVSNLEKVSASENIKHAIQTNFKLYSVAVMQMDIDKNVIAIFDKVTDAAEQTKTDKSSIVRCCKGKQGIANSFLWAYYTPEKVDSEEDQLEEQLSQLQISETSSGKEDSEC